MTLATFQQTLKTLLMTTEGKQALETEAGLRQFLEKMPLSPEERESIARQPLPRLQQYDYMLQANVDETLQSIYPFANKVLGESWDELAGLYFVAYPNPSYQLITVGQAFPDFLKTQGQWMQKYPFLSEMAFYEWVEAELLSAKNPDYPKTLRLEVPQTEQALDSLIPVLNETSVFLQFAYPIPTIIEFLKHHETSELTPEIFAPKATSVWIYRNANPYVCRFFELNPLLASWLGLLKQSLAKGQHLTYRQSTQPILEQLAKTNPGISSEVFHREFFNILQQLLEKGILLGSDTLG